MPQSKPIWLTEVGCPAVDKGANQPNVFSDPKSAESFLPYYSRGFRDDLVQRRYLQAVLETFDPTHPDFQPAANPVSALYGGHMVEPGRTTVYTWDARPYPAFPYARGVWADGGNWEIGHWLTGRVAGGSLAAVVAAILDDHGFTRYVASGLEGMLDGYVIDRPMSARQALQPLELAYFFDSCESAGTIRFSPRGRAGPVTALGIDDLVESGPAADVVQLTRGQDAELPGIVRVGFLDAGQEYRQSAVESRRLTGAARRVAGADLPLVMAPDAARRIAEAMLQDAWGARHRASLALPPSRRALEPGDLLALTVAGRRHDLRITGLSEAGALAVEARSLVSESYEATTPVARDGRAPLPAAFGAPSLAFLDLPLLRGDESPFAVRAAAFQTPWPGGIAFHRATGGGGFAAAGLLRQPATLGRLLAPLPPGPPGRWDRSSAALVEIEGGSLQSVDEAALLGGANTAAVERPDGSWEVVQFASASLVANRTYRLTGLLRDQAGSDRAVPVTLPSGARLVLLDEAVGSLAATADQIGLDVTWRYGPANRGIGHLSYRNATRPLRATGLRPLSPVHVRGRRSGGDLHITWIRRTRIGGDSWEVAEVPLAEEREAYEVDILDGAGVRRTLAATTPGTTYTAAQQTADWGSPQSAYTIAVHQLSAIYGRGTARQATV